MVVRETVRSSTRAITGERECIRRRGACPIDSRKACGGIAVADADLRVSRAASISDRTESRRGTADARTDAMSRVLVGFAFAIGPVPIAVEVRR